MRIVIVIFLSLGLLACSIQSDVYAPVYDVSTIERIPKSGVHHVRIDESLYAIAWRYGFDYQQLANLNHIKPPYKIKVGQTIYLTKKASAKQPLPPSERSITPKSQHSITRLTSPEKEPVASIKHWQWPARGRIVGNFSALNKGINIGGAEGDPIYATASGKVVYCGHGLRGYGNLIIIKHNNMFLTAYAHNSRVFVHEGSWVNAGQKIAEMGHTGTQHTMLHFEIRKTGKPVNPLIYLI